MGLAAQISRNFNTTTSIGEAIKTFRHGKDTSAHQAIQRRIDISLGGLPDRTWKRLHVAQETSGWIRFSLTTASHLLIYGDVLSVKVILG